MSNKGQYLRGEKWYLMNRDVNGNLKEEITKDVQKMADVQVYLDAQKTSGKEEETKSKVKK